MKELKKNILQTSLKSSKGITLITLIVTIVVILIITRISIDVVFTDDTIIKKAQKNKTKIDEKITKETEGVNSLINALNNSMGIGEISIEKTEKYVKYYADINGDGKIKAEDDGIIFADLLIGGNGQWNNTDGLYEISTISSTKDYIISQESYKGDFGTAPVLKANGSGNKRFYVMALSDLDSSYYSWYYSASGNANIANPIPTLNEFGTGKENTSVMIEKWDAGTYGTKNGISSYPDIWGVIKTKYEEDWFVPSKAEWAAFAHLFDIEASNYEQFGLNDWYWSSSLNNSTNAWRAFFSNGYMSTSSINRNRCVRLCTTF